MLFRSKSQIQKVKNRQNDKTLIKLKFGQSKERESLIHFIFFISVQREREKMKYLEEGSTGAVEQEG